MNTQWERIRENFPEEHMADGRPGRRPIPARAVLESALWILNTGAQWHMLPQCSPNYKTVHRRFQNWIQSEVLRDVLTDIANELREQGVLDKRTMLHLRHLCDGEERWRRDRHVGHAPHYPSPRSLGQSRTCLLRDGTPLSRTDETLSSVTELVSDFPPGALADLESARSHG
jgi:transposase